MGSVLQAYADAIFRTAGDELTRRALLGDALAHPTLAHPILAPQVLAAWTPPMESPAARFRAAAHIQRPARGAWPPAAGPPEGRPPLSLVSRANGAPLSTRQSRCRV